MGAQVRGVSLKLQEEERQRRMEYVPAQSAIKTERIVVDKETEGMLKQLGVDFPYVPEEVSAPPVRGPRR